MGGYMSRKKILIVDDATTVVMMHKLILSREGFEILTARDGQEGFDTALAAKPDLILMDVMMPNLGGIDAVRLLRGHEETKAIPVIMVTTRGEAESVSRGLDSGATDYVTKPVDGAELVAKVRARLGV
jgi:DNA-binding response OmpR family regulator